MRKGIQGPVVRGSHSVRKAIQGPRQSDTPKDESRSARKAIPLKMMCPYAPSVRKAIQGPRKAIP
eukprot:6196309-Karenia_brevis.AAC.1